MSSKSEERRRARTDEAVAEEAAPEAPEVTREVPRCCDQPIVFITDGVSANEVGYCAEHLPANLRE